MSGITTLEPKLVLTVAVQATQFPAASAVEEMRGVLLEDVGIPIRRAARGSVTYDDVVQIDLFGEPGGIILRDQSARHLCVIGIAQPR